MAVVGTTGRVAASYSSPALTLTITYDAKPEDSRGLKALEGTLKDNRIRIDSSTDDSIRGWREPWLLW